MHRNELCLFDLEGEIDPFTLSFQAPGLPQSVPQLLGGRGGGGARRELQLELENVRVTAQGRQGLQQNGTAALRVRGHDETYQPQQIQ